MTTRCAWVGDDELLTTYHDREWGVPEFDGRALWESLMLSGFQAGLSWITILRRRDGFRKAFRGFDPDVIGFAPGIEGWILLERKRKVSAGDARPGMQPLQYRCVFQALLPLAFECLHHGFL